MDTIAEHLDLIAADIDRHGVAAVGSDIAAVAEQARAAGVNPVLVSVLTDPTQPEIARARAFGRIAMHLVRPGSGPPTVAARLAATPS